MLAGVGAECLGAGPEGEAGLVLGIRSDLMEVTQEPSLPDTRWGLEVGSGGWFRVGGHP